MIRKIVASLFSKGSTGRCIFDLYYYVQELRTSLDVGNLRQIRKRPCVHRKVRVISLSGDRFEFSIRDVASIADATRKYRINETVP